jgi:hypothetical protein
MFDNSNTPQYALSEELKTVNNLAELRDFLNLFTGRELETALLDRPATIVVYENFLSDGSIVLNAYIANRER